MITADDRSGFTLRRGFLIVYLLNIITTCCLTFIGSTRSSQIIIFPDISLISWCSSSIFIGNFFRKGSLVNNNSQVTNLFSWGFATRIVNGNFFIIEALRFNGTAGWSKVFSLLLHADLSLLSIAVGTYWSFHFFTLKSLAVYFWGRLRGVSG